MSFIFRDVRVLPWLFFHVKSQGCVATHASRIADAKNTSRTRNQTLAALPAGMLCTTPVQADEKCDLASIASRSPHESLSNHCIYVKNIN